MRGVVEEIVSTSVPCSSKSNIEPQSARVVCNVRKPYEAIPSLISLMSFYWQAFDNDPQGFEWVDCNDAPTSVISLLPPTRRPPRTPIVT